MKCECGNETIFTRCQSFIACKVFNQKDGEMTLVEDSGVVRPDPPLWSCEKCCAEVDAPGISAEETKALADRALALEEA